MDAGEAVELKLVGEAAEWDEARLAFRPVFTHQVFDGEKIVGYQRPRVRLYHAASDLKARLASLPLCSVLARCMHARRTARRASISPPRVPQAFLDFRHDGAIDADAGAAADVQPDDVVAAVAKFLPKDYTSNADAFLASLAEQGAFVPPGCKAKEYRSARVDEQDAVFEVYKCNGATPGFAAYHERLQTFLIWFIEAASFIDLDDDDWTAFVLYSKRRTSAGGSLYRPMGYMTVYDFYAYPNGKRPRISQMVVFPPYQRRGHGAALLQSVYDDCSTRPEVIDITVEDPSPEFVKASNAGRAAWDGIPTHDAALGAPRSCATTWTAATCSSCPSFARRRRP